MSKTYLIISAMREELSSLVEQMQITTHQTNLNLQIWTGQLLDRDVVLAVSGIGKVNAALATQYLIDNYQLDHIFNVGVAGGSNTKVSVGDVCFATQVIQNDVDTTVFGYKKGEIPRMDTSCFSSTINQSILTQLKQDDRNYQVHSGLIISADQFTTDRQTILKLGAKFKALAKDMESAAIGHTAHLNHVPFTIIRGISDSSGQDAGDEYKTNLNLAIQNSLSAFTGYFQQL
jgi:adenosylhomocysteine nucleosidase